MATNDGMLKRENLTMTGLLRLLGIYMVTSLLVVGCDDRGHQEYEFSVDGLPNQSLSYSLDGDAGITQPGDVVVLDRYSLSAAMFLTLGEQRSCAFARRADGCLLLNAGSGDSQIVYAVVPYTWNKASASREEVLNDPLTKMSPSEIRGLWGLRLSGWPKGIEEQLACIDTSRTCVAISGPAAAGAMDEAGRDRTGRPFPSLPEKLRYLVVQDTGFSTSADYSSLRQLKDIAFLSFQTGAQEGFDASIISGNANLHYLSLAGSRVANGQTLSGLTELRCLDISRTMGLDDVDFVRSMSQLRVLNLDVTKVSSLSPLSNSSSIREIYAADAQVKDLPVGELPSLRLLNVISTQVSTKLAEEFGAAHPRCLVHYSWNVSLHRALEGADRLRLVSKVSVDPRENLFETTDPGEIKRLLDQLEVDESPRSGGVKEVSLRVLEFYRGGQQVAAIGCVFATALRWPDGPWPHDAMLTKDSKQFLQNWLTEKGCKGALW